MKYKVSIVGSGINGLLSAYYLTKLGHDISVYERGPIPNPNAASFGNHRLIHPWNKYDDAEKIKNSIISLQLWKEILAEIGSDGFVQTDVLAVNTNHSVYTSQSELLTQVLCKEKLVKKWPIFEADHLDSGIIFNEFGVLLAKNILFDLVKFLERNGVNFYPNHNVKFVDAKVGEILFSNGSKDISDLIIISAGTGIEKLFLDSNFHLIRDIKFNIMRCYVIYVHHRDLQIVDECPAWANLGAGDMWGIPPVRGINMKLGCGEFTQKVLSNTVNNSNNTIGFKILNTYLQKFSWFKNAEIMSESYNHWTKISSNQKYISMGYCKIILSDNGEGFKFAPVIAKNLSELIQ